MPQPSIQDIIKWQRNFATGGEESIASYLWDTLSDAGKTPRDMTFEYGKGWLNPYASGEPQGGAGWQFKSAKEEDISIQDVFSNLFGYLGDEGKSLKDLTEEDIRANLEEWIGVPEFYDETARHPLEDRDVYRPGHPEEKAYKSYEGGEYNPEQFDTLIRAIKQLQEGFKTLPSITEYGLDKQLESEQIRGKREKDVLGAKYEAGAPGHRYGQLAQGESPIKSQLLQEQYLSGLSGTKREQELALQNIRRDYGDEFFGSVLEWLG